MIQANGGSKTITVDCLLRAGWATITISVSHKEYIIHASYLHDSLNDLLSASIMLATGITDSECSMVDEPGEAKLVFEQRKNELLIEAYSFNSWMMRPFQDCSGHAKAVFSEKVSFDDFISAVLSMFDTLLEKHPGDDYHAVWGYHYPIDKINKLRKVISE